MATKKVQKNKYDKPAWLKLSEEELKKIIKDLSEKHQPAQIGLILRDQYGIPTTKVYGKKLAEYLEDLGKDPRVDLKNVEKKLEKIREHLKSNITDRASKHKMQKIQSRVNALKKYEAKRK